MMRILIGFFAAALAVSAAADENAVKYRQNTMEAIGGHMGALAQIVKGEVDHKDHIPVHVAGLAGLSGVAPDLFGADSREGADTDALPKIWEDPAAFKERLTAFRTAALDLEAVVKAGDMTKFPPAFGALGKSCKGCHDDFKKKD
jgi:cytochrome c556